MADKILGSNAASTDVLFSLTEGIGKPLREVDNFSGGGGGAVDSVNGQTGVVVLDADDIDDTSTTNKFTNAAAIAKLAGIEAGAEVNTINAGDNVSELVNDTGFITAAGAPVQSVNAQTGAVTLTKADIGLSNVDNTSDLAKPISTATQTALDGKATSAQGALADTALQPADNVSELTNDAGYITSAESPVQTVNTQTGNVVLDADDISDAATTNKFTSQAEIDKLAGIESGAQVNTINSGDNVSLLANDAGYITSAESPVQTVNTQTGVVVLDADDIGDAATVNKFTTQAEIDKLAGIETGAQVNTINAGDNVSVLVNDAAYITSAEAPVQSVNTQTGAVTLTKSDVGLGNVDNTSDLDKPISTATQTALDLKLELTNGQLLLPSWTFGDDPAYSFVGFTDSGLRMRSALSTTRLEIAIDGVQTVTFDPSGITMNVGTQVTSGAAPTNGSHLTNKLYVDNLFADAVQTSGDQSVAGNKTFTGTTTTGDISMSSGSVLSLNSDSSLSTPVLTFTGADEGKTGLGYSLAGGPVISYIVNTAIVATMFENLIDFNQPVKFSNNVISEVGDPILGTDAANKNYVDSVIGASGTTAERPISPVVGQQFYDTTIDRPVWYDGTNWRNAVGQVS